MYSLTNKLRKTWLDEFLKSPVSEESSTSNMVNVPKHCSKLNGSTFTIFIDPVEKFYVESPWVIWKILGPFVNLLTVQDKYFLLNRGNLLQHFQIQLCQKQKTFSSISVFFFFFAFSQFRFNFEHFQKKTRLIADVFLNLRTPKNVVR